MSYKKIAIALSFILLAIIITAWLWHMPFLLSFLLIFFAYVKHVLAPIKKELLWFCITGTLGVVTEILIMWLGNYPWRYAVPSILNIPLWLIPLWGLAGTILLTLYEEVKKCKYFQ